ncbi:MAG: glutamyl-tRNA reductase [Acidilobaceae archaeon]
MIGDGSLLRAYAITHRRCPLAEISSLGRRRDELYSRLKEEARGLVILSTCNRFEVYADSPSASFEPALRSLLGESSSHLDVYEGLSAVRHLIEVASGLDSQVLGEQEILGQVREAWLYARRARASSKLLDYVFSRALRAARRVRRETRIGWGVVGYPQAGIELLAAKLGGLNGRVVVLVGAGQAGEAALRHLCKKYEPSRVVLVNRTLERARALTTLCSNREVQVESLDSLERVLSEADAVFVAVSGGHRLVSRDIVEASGAIFVDISLPPVVEKVPGRVFYMEDVRVIADENMKIRLSEVPRALSIIEEEAAKIERFLNRVPVEEMIAEMMKRVRELYVAEVSRLTEAEGGVSREKLELLLDSYTRKVLRPLLLFMRSGASNGNMEAVRGIYSLYVRELERMTRGERGRVPSPKT